MAKTKILLITREGLKKVMPHSDVANFISATIDYKGRVRIKYQPQTALEPKELKSKRGKG